ncbi:hypothetical protein PG984_009942 [Apiospora sp. TS-2023a]
MNEMGSLTKDDTVNSLVGMPSTLGPSSRTAAEDAVQNFFSDKIHILFPDEEQTNKEDGNDSCARDEDDDLSVVELPGSESEFGLDEEDSEDDFIEL